jgi:chromosome segregation ATPase
VDLPTIFGIDARVITAVVVMLCGPAGVLIFFLKVLDQVRANSRLQLERQRLRQEGELAGATTFNMRIEALVTQIDKLWVENAKLHEQIDEHEKKLEQCQTERDDLRRKLMKAQDDITGFQRELAQIGQSAMHVAQDGNRLHVINPVTPLISPKETSDD